MTSWAHPIPYVTGTSGAYFDLQRGVREKAFRTPFSFLTAPRLQPQVREHLLDDRLFLDGRDDHQLAAALQAVLHQQDVHGFTAQPPPPRDQTTPKRPARNTRSWPRAVSEANEAQGRLSTTVRTLDLLGSTAVDGSRNACLLCH